MIMRPTEPFRHEHQELLEHIEHLALAAREMPRLSDEERDALRKRILGFLRGTSILPQRGRPPAAGIRRRPEVAAWVLARMGESTGHHHAH